MRITVLVPWRIIAFVAGTSRIRNLLSKLLLPIDTVSRCEFSSFNGHSNRYERVINSKKIVKRCRRRICYICYYVRLCARENRDLIEDFRINIDNKIELIFEVRCRNLPFHTLLLSLNGILQFNCWQTNWNDFERKVILTNFLGHRIGCSR